MPGDTSPWGTTEWENHVQKLLKRRYKDTPGKYQPVPDETHGDCGLEGFTTDGVAYQCYSAQDWLPTTLYEKQRDKITHDLNTFVDKAQELTKILGGMKIKQWNLVVPCWRDKELHKHARKKEKEIRTAAPAHASTNFKIGILTEEDFAVEAKELADAGVIKFKKIPGKVADDELSKWLSESKNVDLVNNLNRKVSVIAVAQNATKTEAFRLRIVRNYIRGNITLATLQSELPEIYDELVRLKDQREGDLDTETITMTAVPKDFFQQTLDRYKEQLRHLPGLSQSAMDVLANEAVADWLLRCPLDF